jgi:hypothetical protein
MTDMTQSRTMGRPAARGNERGDRRSFVMGATEARPGIMTTEFWLSFLGAVGIVIAAYISDTFSNDLGWALGAGLIATYSLSRGLAKSGSREGPFLVGKGGETDR